MTPAEVYFNQNQRGRRPDNLGVGSLNVELQVLGFRFEHRLPGGHTDRTLPIAMGYGAGAESRRPPGLAVVGGLLFSQMLTLYVTPVVYVYLERFQAWLKEGAAQSAT